MQKIAVMANAGAGKDTVADMILEFAAETSWGDEPGDKIALAAPLKDFCDDVFRFSPEQLWGSSEARNMVDRRYSDERPGRWGNLIRWWRRGLYEVNRTNAAQRYADWADSWLEDVLPANTNIPKARVLLDAWFHGVINQKHLTARYALQTLGTEFGRHIDPDIWVDYLLREVGDMEQAGMNAAVVTDCRFVNEARKLRAAGFEIWRLIRPDAKAIVGGAVNHASEREQTSPEMEPYISTTIINDGTLDDLEEKVRALLEA